MTGATSTPSAKERYALIGVAATGLLLRLAALIESQANPLLRHPTLDEAYYTTFGQAVASGFWIGEERVFFMDPLYGYLVGLVYLLFGPELNIVRLFQIATDTLNIVLLYAVGRRLDGGRTGLIAAAIYALYPVAFFYSLLILKTTFTVTFALAFVVAAINVTEKDNNWRWAALGAFTALGIWLRGNLLLFAPFFLAVWWLIDRPAPRRFFVRGAIYLGALFLVLQLGALRNYMVAGEWIAFSSQSGRLLYLSNNRENKNGLYYHPTFFSTLHVGGTEGAEREFHREAERRLGRTLSSKEASTYWRNEALGYLAGHPGEALLLLGNKLKRTLGAQEIPINLSFDTAKSFSTVMRAPFPSFTWIVALGVPGLILLFIRRRQSAWLLVPVATFLGTILIFYTSSRFRFPLVPFLALGSAATILYFIEGGVKENLKEKGIALTVTLALLAYSYAVPPTPAGGAEEYALARAYKADRDLKSAYQLAVVGAERYPEQVRFPVLIGAVALAANDFDRAITYSERAITMNPAYADPYHNGGMAWLMKGEPDTAVAWFEKALQRNAPPLTWFALAKAHLAANRPDQAKTAIDRFVSLIPPGHPMRKAAHDLLATPPSGG